MSEISTVFVVVRRWKEFCNSSNSYMAKCETYITDKFESAKSRSETWKHRYPNSDIRICKEIGDVR